MILRTRTAREARAVAEGGEAQAEARREFDRLDRLFIRFPVYGGHGSDPPAARLLNRKGKELHSLPVATIAEGVYQIDLQLSLTVRDDYLVAIEARRGTESATALVPFTVR
jgi:hypothetical protein